MASKESGKEFIQSVIGKHLAANVRRYKYLVFNGSAHNTELGYQADAKPFEGTVVDADETWILIKQSRADFAVAEKALLETVPEVGTKVLLTPYARRQYDGTRIDAPKEDASGTPGIFFSTIIIGESRSRIPVDVQKLRSSYLKDMIDQIYRFKCPDGVRNLSNALVDFGGQHPEFFGVIDPPDNDCLRERPAIKVAVNNQKATNGCLTIEYDRVLDAYDISLLSNGNEIRWVESVFFDDLAVVCCDMADDGQWKTIKVKVLKSASKPRKKAA